MRDLDKVLEVADKFLSITNQELPEGFKDDLAICLATYQVRSSTPLDLNAMLATDDVYSFKHDVVGIFNNEQFFVPRFAI